jgi:hypothetical protein
MKMSEAMEIIGSNESGFMVSYEHVEGCFLASGYFPDKHSGEPLIPTLEEAWALARAFAAKTYGKYVNIYVIDSHFVPVPGYKDGYITNR